MKKLKILFLTGEIYPDIWGGADIYLYELCRHLGKRGHEITVLTGKENKKDKPKEVIETFTLERYDWTRYRPLLINRWSKSLALKKVFLKKIKEEKFDIVHINSAQAWLTANNFDQLPVFQSFHSPSFEEELIESKKVKYAKTDFKKYLKKVWLPLSVALTKRLERNCYNSADQLIVLSQFMKKRLEDCFGVNARKIILIFGGVDIQKFKPGSQKKARQKLKLPQNKKIIICSRRLVARMGLENLLEAFKIVNEQLPESLLLITGDGALKEKLEEKAKVLGLGDKIIFTGFVEGNMLPVYFQASDLFVLPTEKLEGFGLATIEALSTGLPALGTPVGGTKEVLGKLDCQLLFDGVEPEKMAPKIITFLKKENRQLRERCRKYVVENYAWPKIAEQVEAQYLKAVKQ